MTQREAAEVFRKALDRGLLEAFVRSRRGWEVARPGSGPQRMSSTEAIAFAKRLQQRL